MMAASFKGHTAVVKMLLDKGASIDLQNKVGQRSMVWCDDRRCRRAKAVFVWQA